MRAIEISLHYGGRSADAHEINFYDVGQALIGFERSLALTTHLVLNGQIITQAPALKGAEIFARPPDRGSWEVVAGIVIAGAAAAYKLGTAPKDTPIGHLIRSAYDYVISETLGMHVDYEKTLGQQYKELQTQNDAIETQPETKFDSLVEKCEVAIRDMHRPIAKSGTAEYATLSAKIDSVKYGFDVTLTQETYNYIAFTDRSSSASHHVGSVSSYNMNTFKGRMYLAEYGRPIPFELSESSRTPASVVTVGASLTANIEARIRGEIAGGAIEFMAFQNLSRTGRLKSIFIVEVFGTVDR